MGSIVIFHDTKFISYLLLLNCRLNYKFSPYTLKVRIKFIFKIRT